MIAGTEQLHDRVNAAHATRKRESMATVLERGHIPLEGFTGRVLASGVLVPFVLPQSFLNVRRCKVHRGHDRTGQGVGALTGVNCPGSKTCAQVIIKNARHDDTLVVGVRKITAPRTGRN